MDRGLARIILIDSYMPVAEPRRWRSLDTPASTGEMGPARLWSWYQ